MKLALALLFFLVTAIEIVEAAFLLTGSPPLTQTELEARDRVMLYRGYDCALNRMAVNRCEMPARE